MLQRNNSTGGQRPKAAQEEALRSVIEAEKHLIESGMEIPDVMAKKGLKDLLYGRKSGLQAESLVLLHYSVNTVAPGMAHMTACRLCQSSQYALFLDNIIYVPQDNIVYFQIHVSIYDTPSN